jgi:hypothetical protein
MTNFSNAPEPYTGQSKKQGLIDSDSKSISLESNIWTEWSKHAGTKLALTLVGIGIGAALSADEAVAIGPGTSATFNLLEKDNSPEPVGLKSVDRRQDQVTETVRSDYYSDFIETDRNLNTAPVVSDDFGHGAPAPFDNAQGLISSNVPTIPNATVWSLIYMGGTAAGMWLLGRRIAKNFERLPPEVAKSKAELQSDLINPYAPPTSHEYFED